MRFQGGRGGGGEGYGGVGGRRGGAGEEGEGEWTSVLCSPYSTEYTQDIIHGMNLIRMLRSRRNLS